MRSAYGRAGGVKPSEHMGARQFHHESQMLEMELSCLMSSLPASGFVELLPVELMLSF